MSLTRALIDAEFHDTPIGRCVVLPSRYSCSGAPPCDPPNPARNDCCDAVDPSDVLAVVETDTSAFSAMGSLVHVRRGFVRVVEVLPVLAASHADGFNGPHICIQPGGRVTVHRGGKWVDADLPVSPGDVVLVVEPWCETPPPPVRVIHRDGVLGEVRE